MTSPSQEPLVSILTPFHDTETYLAECIESVLAQSYRNFEYILVDNQSKDRSREIAAAYAKRDERIRVLETESLLTQIQNYNGALRHVSPRSSYCKIVQADDWIFPTCLTEMVALAEQHPSVAIVSSYQLHDTMVYGTGLPPSTRVISGREACRLHLLNGIFLFGSQTTVLYRADVVRSRPAFYEEGTLHPDTEAVFQILADNDFGFVHQVLSYTRVHDDSISGSIRDFTPQAVDRLIIAKRYGERYLDSAEFETCLDDAYRGLYRSMGARWLTDLVSRKKDGFWEHQRKGLETVGETIRPSLLAQSASVVLLKSILSPINLVRMLRPQPTWPRKPGSLEGPRGRRST